MWAITSYYNPARYRNRLPNYRVFRAKLAVPLVAVELSFDGNFELTEKDADVLIQISGGAILWQKERLLNIAFESIPAGENNIAWLDSDIIFDRPDWVEAAENKLKDFNIVQLFSEIVHLDHDDHELTASLRDRPVSGWSFASLVREPHTDIATMLEQLVHSRTKCTGHAWAARRPLLEAHGLYDAMIIGGGDRSVASALYGHFEITAHQLNSARREHYLRWARPYHRAVGGRIGHIDGRLYHLWHGDAGNRKYGERHRWFSGFDFDPDADLKIGSNGAWQWARPRPELETFLGSYFVNRAEDG